ncbi:MAG: hypothetical protein OHK0046_46200 [Anaerolineae bacterium]
MSIKEGTYNEREGSFEVFISQAYWLGKYPITQSQWQAVMNTNPSEHKGPNLPVESISWHDAIDFCESLNKIPNIRPDGYIFSLPTEAQWEYACKAGLNYKYQVGNTLDDLSRVAWYSVNTTQYKTHYVGQKDPNDWGFHDMLGNVLEWCFDSCIDYPDGTSQSDWIGGTDDAFRNLRGGSAMTQPGGFALTCSERGYRHGEDGNQYTGFRVCLRPKRKLIDIS